MLSKSYFSFRKLSDFKRHVMTLVSGTVAAQLIALLAMPLLTRMYVPADFAVLAIFVGIVSIAGSIVAGRYELTIMHAASADEADRLVVLALVVTAMASLLMSVLAMLFAEPIVTLLGMPELLSWMYWLAFPLFATGVMQVFSNRLNWQKQYATIARGRVLQNGGNMSVSLSMGWLKWGGGMLVGHVAGLLFAAVYFWRKSGFGWRKPERSESRELAKKYIHYPMYSAPAALLDVASMYACIFILGHFYSNDVLGQFSLTHRLLLIPMVFIGAAVGQTFFQRAAEHYRQGQNPRSFLVSTTKKLLLYSLPLFIVLMVIAPDLFAWVFGPEWREAGTYVRWVALAYWVRFGVSPVSTVFLVVDRVKAGTLWQVIYFISSFTVLGLAAMSGLSIIQFLMLYAVHEAVLYALYFWMGYRVCKADSSNARC